MSKITFLAEHCWLIRWTNKDGRQMFFVASNIWDASPAPGHVTVFPSEQAAENNIANHKRIFPREEGEIYEAVPMYGALLTKGTPIQIKDGRIVPPEQ